ncbi:hypothetical protein [Microbacterium lacticum]
MLNDEFDGRFQRVRYAIVDRRSTVVADVEREAIHRRRCDCDDSVNAKNSGCVSKLKHYVRITMSPFGVVRTSSDLRHICDDDVRSFNLAENHLPDVG